MTTIYPNNYDSEATMPTVRNDVIAVLMEDLHPDGTYISVDSPELFSPSGGFCTVYSFHDSIHAEERAATYSYSSISGNKLIGINGLRHSSITRARGCKVYGNIMAEHREAITDAALNLQHDLGHVGTDDKSTIEWFANLFVNTIKKPKVWFDIGPSSTGFVYMPFRFKDQTYRLQSWQSVSWEWSFGDGTNSDEQHPTHVYERPGKYDVTLKVTNDYGVGVATVKGCITVQGVMPESCDTTIDPSNAVAGETVVTMSCRPAVTTDSRNPVNRVEWITGQDNDEPLVGTFVRAVFEQAGIFTPEVTQRTIYGNFSSHTAESINVIERGSAWLMIQEHFSPRASVDEMMPSSKTWKVARNDFPAPRDWSLAGDVPERMEDFLFSGGMHDFPGTFESLLLYASSPTTMEYGEYDALSGTYRHIGSRSRGWGWTSSRINTKDEDPIQSQQVYILFGRSNPQSPSDSDLLTVEHYGMNTRTWETLSIMSSTETVDDEDTMRDLSETPSGNKPRRWRSANWREKIYVLGSTSSDVMNRFTSFKPSTRTWRAFNEPSISKRSIDLDECTVFSLSNGLYFADNRRFLVSYDPDSDVWKSIGGEPLWSRGSQAKDVDPSMLLKSAYMSATPKMGNTKAYITPFGRDSFVEFNEGARTSSLLPYRRQGHVSAMAMM